MTTYSLKEEGDRLLTGVSIGQAMAAGKAQVIESADQIAQVEDDAILVTGMTDPDWVKGCLKPEAPRAGHLFRPVDHRAVPARPGPSS